MDQGRLETNQALQSPNPLSNTSTSESITASTTTVNMYQKTKSILLEKEHIIPEPLSEGFHTKCSSVKLKLLDVSWNGPIEKETIKRYPHVVRYYGYWTWTLK